MNVHVSYGIADKLLTLAAVLFQLAVLALIAYGVSYFVYFPFFTAKITVKDIQEDGVVTIESLYLFALASDEVAFGGPDGPEVVEKLNLIW